MKGKTPIKVRFCSEKEREREKGEKVKGKNLVHPKEIKDAGCER